MKTLALTTAIAAALAAPAAYASDSLARSLGVEPDRFTTAELIELRTAMEDQNTVYVNYLLDGGAGPVDSSIALEFRTRQAVEDQDWIELRHLQSGGAEVISTQSFGHNERAQAIFERLAAE